MAQASLLDSVLWHFRSWDQIKKTSLFTLSNYANVFMFFILIGVGLYQIKQKRDDAKNNPRYLALPAPDFPPITQLEKFDWKTTEPLKLRPFKPKYHLTMVDSTALEGFDPNELILMDKNYQRHITHRRRIMEENPNITLGLNNDTPQIRAAITELYTFLTGTYLPTRYPSMFKLHHTQYEYGVEGMLQNLVTGELIPIRPTGPTTPPTHLLRILGRHLDEDFFFLLPSSSSSTTTTTKPSTSDHPATGQKPGDARTYVLEAYVSSAPSGFNPAEKLGKTLAEVHGPVPGYAAKLEGSMDRFFAKVEVGKYVKRANWGITLNAEVFQPGVASNDAVVGAEIAEMMEEVDPDETFVRCERQTLHRLPKSQALVFAFKTYMSRLREIKDEGLGEELATAIEGLKEGSVPEVYLYKRGAEWGNAVKRYLRS